MWQVQSGALVEGPLDERQIVDRIRSGALAAGALMREEGTETWLPVEASPFAAHLPRARAGAAAPRTDAVSFHDPLRLTNWLTGFLVAYGGLTLLCFGLALPLLPALLRLPPDARISTEVDWAMQWLALGEFVQYLEYLVTAVLFCRWIFVAARNVRGLGATDLEYTPGWSVGWYFVPFLNMWKPYRAMKEIWRASYDPADWRQQGTGPLLPVWWGLWIVSALASQAAARASMEMKDGNSARMAILCSLVSYTLNLLLTGVAIAMVRQIAAAQRRTARLPGA